MSVQTNHRVEGEVAARPVVPRWAKEDWEATINRFLRSVDHLPADVEKAYRMLSGPPERGTVRSLEDVWSAICPVFFHLGRLAEFLMEINWRVLALRNQEAVAWEQLQFYVLRLFCEAAARVRGSTDDWLSSIPE
jgi:hypothetical protein